MTGVNSAYEPPPNPDFIANGVSGDIAAAVAQLADRMVARRAGDVKG
jgi:adenylylsulfate kinase-like enzyme